MELEVLYSSGLRRTWPIQHKQRTLTMTTFHRRRTRQLEFPKGLF